ncbi:hypothetical protein [Pantoea brenneri]|uniref:hypothetical protein n=1 Tax=Pantoea brenneri TaxID=472694 RepID=UPI0028E3CED9|nr:hypothetical protein [Pantoea brenneri]
MKPWLYKQHGQIGKTQNPPFLVRLARAITHLIPECTRHRGNDWRFFRGYGMFSSSTRIACALSLFVAARITLIGFVSHLKRSADRLKRMPKSTRWAHTPVAKHRGPRTKTPGAFLNNAKRWPVYGRTSGMRCVIARAEPARDGVFCVFAKGVCALSLRTNLNTTPLVLSQRTNLNTTPLALSQRINLNTTPLGLRINLSLQPAVFLPDDASARREP